MLLKKWADDLKCSDVEGEAAICVKAEELAYLERVDVRPAVQPLGGHKRGCHDSSAGYTVHPVYSNARQFVS